MGDQTILSPVRRGGGEDPPSSVWEEESVHSVSVCELYVHDNFARWTWVVHRKIGKKLLAGMAVLKVVENVLQRAAEFRTHCRV